MRGVRRARVSHLLLKDGSRGAKAVQTENFQFPFHVDDVQVEGMVARPDDWVCWDATGYAA